MDKTQEDIIKGVVAVVAPLLILGLLEKVANKKTSKKNSKRNELRYLYRELHYWNLYKAPKMTPEARRIKENEMLDYIAFVRNH